MSQKQIFHPENSLTMEILFQKNGFMDYRWIEPGKIVVAQWVRMKCLFGCPEYGANASCPPHVPSVAECERFFKEYSSAVIFHFVKTGVSAQENHDWARKTNRDLLKLERAVFLAGYQKAFLLLVDACTLCANCTGERSKCNNPKSARPAVEALAVDVYTTVKNVNYPIHVLANEQEEMNRYAILLIE